MDDARPQPRRIELKASTTDQWRLLDIQALDTRLAQIEHRRRTLPEHAELAEIDQQAATLRDEIVAAETEQSDVQRELAKAEADVELVRQRAARDQARLDSGQGGHKELESLQHELATLGRRQSDLEDAELEVMERLETVTARVEELQGRRRELDERREDATARRDRQTAELDSERDRLAGDRQGAVAGVDGALLALYDKVRASAGGLGAAPLRQRRCGGCNLELTPTDIGRIRAADEDEVLRCDECRRILVRTSESGL